MSAHGAALAHLEPSYTTHALLGWRFRNAASRAAPRRRRDGEQRTSITHDLGERWLTAGRGALLRVPSGLGPPAAHVRVATARLRPGRMRVTRLGAFPCNPRRRKV